METTVDDSGGTVEAGGDGGGGAGGGGEGGGGAGGGGSGCSGGAGEAGAGESDPPPPPHPVSAANINATGKAFCSFEKSFIKIHPLSSLVDQD
jgi:hypothetical protein